MILLVADFIDPKNAYPGRMAPNTSVAFALSGLFILCMINRSQWLRSWRVGATELLALIVFSLGTEGMIGHVHGIALAYTWGSYTHMAVLTAAGFMALGAGMMALAWHRLDTRVARIPLWVPGLLCYVVLMADMATPRGVAMGIAYVPLIFCSLWFTRPNTAFVFAALATAPHGPCLLRESSGRCRHLDGGIEPRADDRGGVVHRHAGLHAPQYRD